MKYGNLILEKKEYAYLCKLLGMVGYKDDLHKACYTKLKEELKNAIVKEDKEMPSDVVRFNSIVDIDTPMGLKQGYELVTPDKSNVYLKRISVLTPMGSALIGYACNDEITWTFPDGEKKVKIRNIVRYNEL